MTIEVTAEMLAAFNAAVKKAPPGATDLRARGIAAVLAIVERDRGAMPMSLAVGRLQAYCGRAEQPHAGHVWTTEPGRWCPGTGGAS